jgi:hypothetical protein
MQLRQKMAHGRFGYSDSTGIKQLGIREMKKFIKKSTNEKETSILPT